MNPITAREKLISLGYKQVPDYDNSFYLWVSPHARITFIFNYEEEICYAYLSYTNLISNKSDLEFIKQAYIRMKNDSNALTKIGVEIHDLQFQ